ncbi:MAG: TIGR03545 family protein [Elusimicrobiaceae bacterium]|nr:TIGR03545 family protein [Elusimicrobiaceae bacterium]
MRWKYLLPRLGILVLIWAACLFGTDPALRWGLTKAAQSAAGAKAEIAKVRTKFFPPSLSVHSVTVGDKNEPFKNIFEFERLELSFQGRPLLEKKFIITEAGLTGLKFGTVRKTSCALPKARESGFMSRKMAEVAGAGKEFSLRRLSELKAGGMDLAQVKFDALKTPALAAALKAGLEADTALWRDKFKAADFPAGLQALADRAKSLNDIKDPIKKVTEGAAIIKEAGRLRDEAERMGRAAEETVAAANASVRQLDAARKADIETVMAGMKVPSLDSHAITDYLLGPAVTGKVDTVLNWYGATRKYMPENTARADNAARVGTGSVIEFPKEKNYPSFAIEKLYITGEIKPAERAAFKFYGEADGITSQPALYGKPAHLTARGTSGPRSLAVSATFDRTARPGTDSGSVQLSGFPLAEIKAGSPSEIEITAGGGTVSATGAATVTGGVLDSTLAVRVEGVSLTADMQADSTTLEIVRAALKTALANMKTLEVKVRLAGEWDRPAIAIESNLSDEISKGLNQFVGREIDKYRQQAAAEVDKLQAQARAELVRQIAQLQTQSDSQLEQVRRGSASIIADLNARAGGTVLPGVSLPKIKLPKISF